MILIETQKEEFNKLKDIRIFGKTDNEKSYNGDFLVIGLGGLGGRVVCKLKSMLQDEVSFEDNINYLMIDSDIPNMEQTIEDSKEGNGLNALEVLSIYRPNLTNILANGINANPVHPNLAKWMKPDFPNIKIGTEGAKGNRQVGRLMFSNAYEDMRILLFEKLEEIYTRSNSGKLDIILVSSVCGGTGSGILADVTYNIKAYAKSKKWKNVRVGGCLLMPDVLFANKSITKDEELVSLLNANGCATLKEVDYLMRIAKRGEGFVFESTTHRLSMVENIFDACMLVSGKKDEQGYVPDHIICGDVAYFLSKLAENKYIGGSEGEDRRLLRDSFFEHNEDGSFKIVNESDYKIPIKEIENICENNIYQKANELLHDIKINEADIERDMSGALGELKTFLNGKPGDEISINVAGLIKPNQFQKPQYKLIKKGHDDLRTVLPRQLSRLEGEISVVIKSIKNKLCSNLNEQVNNYLHMYGPFVTIKLIGSAGVGGVEFDTGMIAELKKLEELRRSYVPSNEQQRIIESILDIVSKRFFTFPNAKRETENGYFDACMKDALEKERTMIMDGLDANDVLGDAIRLLRQKAEHLEEIYADFERDLTQAVKELSDNGKKVASYLIKGAKNQEFLPSDYITEARIDELRRGIIDMMLRHEADIDAGRPVPVMEEIEKLYRNILLGIGVYAPEKLIAISYADKVPTLQEANVMFVSPTNDKREEIMTEVAKAFVEGAWEKNQKKQLCVLKEDLPEHVEHKKYISLPEAMPYFSKAVKAILTEAPYNENEKEITTNKGEIAISVDDIFMGVPISTLACAKDMQKAYDAVDKTTYFGLHTDENTKDMVSYPDVC